MGDVNLPLTPLSKGLPQGLPVLAIFFALYLAPLLHLLEGRGFGYANDVGILRVGTSLEETTLGRKDDTALIAE